MNKQADLEAVKTYFSRFIAEHGSSPRGVDWNSTESQEVRFEQLVRLIRPSTEPCSVLDYGCGYGALAGYLERQGLTCAYHGYDIVEEAVRLAEQQNAGFPNRSFSSDEANLPTVDYVVASGIFNVRSEASFDDWTAHVIRTLDRFAQLGRKGFASNFLTKYSDSDRMRPHLYYADPAFLFDYAKRHYSRNVAILHDYDIYDFTLIVRS